MSASDDFRTALRQGSGRAMLCLRAQPANSDYQAALLDACLTVQTYDRQCEESREGYLFDLIQATGDPVKYRDALLSRLAACKDAGCSDDMVQPFAILCRFAAADPSFDRGCLRDYVTTLALENGGVDCIFALVRLEGIDGLVFVARQFHAQLTSAEDEWDWIVDALLSEAKEMGITEDVLKSRRLDCSLLDDLVRRRELRIPLERTPEPQVPFSALVANGAKVPCFSMQWVRQASQVDLEEAAEALLSEQDPKRLRAYARIFLRRPFPLDFRPLIKLLWSSDTNLSYLVARILGQIRHVDIRGLALNDLEGQDRFEIALHLLLENYEPIDAALILSILLTWRPSEDLCHDISSAILPLAAKHAAPVLQWQEILEWVYINTPCSICRRTAVSNLVRLSLLSDALAAECLHDADSDTVRLARDHMLAREANAAKEK